MRMVILNSNDVFSIRLATLVADYDHETLINLYQPIIGHGATILYFTLLYEAAIQRVTSIASHETLLAKMQMATGDFLKARKTLEAIGLLRTYLEKNDESKIYHYELYAPKTPAEFFNDTLLYGLLINFIGEVDAKKLNNYYGVTMEVEGEDISASFKQIFHPDFENQAFLRALQSDPGRGRNRAMMKLEFTFGKFFLALKEVSQISETAFSKAELSEILRLASLYGVNETSAASVVSHFYDPSQEKGKRLDIAGITKAFQEETNYSYLSSFNGNRSSSSGPNFVSSKGKLAQKINLMESVSPKDYLSILQGGTEPALPDLRLLDYLSKKFRLPNAVLNAVIDYTLSKNNNVLSKSYMEKICASLVRSNITTTVDAMNYLKSISNGGKKSKKPSVEGTGETTKEKKPKSSSSKEEEEEWDKLMQELEDIGDDSDDGKA